MAGDWVHLHVEEIERATDAAFLVRLPSGDLVWLPRSQVADAADYAAGDRDVTLPITDWIAKQKGLEE